MSSDTPEKPVASDPAIVAKPRGPTHRQLLNKLYALPVPLRTYPLPTFVPHNPLSLFHILYTWIYQTFSRPSSHPEVLYEAWFSAQSQSVHVADHKTVRALWEQGFFGKGTLSRSEPSWLEKEKRRRGDAAKETSEERTNQRRAERQQVKWERARKEREAIDQKLEEERQASELRNNEPPQAHEEPPKDSSNSTSLETGDIDLQERKKSVQPGLCQIALVPVDPMQLLRLPNSQRELQEMTGGNVDKALRGFDYEKDLESTVAELESLMADAMKGADDGDERLNQLEQLLSGIMSDLPAELELDTHDAKDTVQHRIETIQEQSSSDDPDLQNGPADSEDMNGVAHANGTLYLNGSAKTNGAPTISNIQSRSQKTVRFSPTTEETIFTKTSHPSSDSAAPVTEQVPITDQEHLQLSMEEAFFLSYGLGVLKVLDPSTKQPMTNTDLLRLCRQSSFFPSKVDFTPQPDDPFMLSYVVYHHFRSLGWVVRGGVKFAVDFLLYNRGPVFSHAEFAILILPSYSHSYWSSNEAIREYVAGKEKRDWHWLHSINRVNGQVKKTLVLVYVDIPPPLTNGEEKLGIDGVLGRYRVREVVVRRWLYNRMRA